MVKYSPENENAGVDMEAQSEFVTFKNFRPRPLKFLLELPQPVQIQSI